MSCIHIPLSSESHASQNDILLFEQRTLLFTSPSKISDKIPQTIVTHFSNVFEEKPEVWTPRPPRTPTSFIEPQIIRQIHKKHILKTNNAVSEITREKNTQLKPSPYQSIPNVEIPYVLFQEEPSVWVVKTEPHRVLTWNVSWNNQQHQQTTISDHLGNTYIDFTIKSTRQTISALSVEIDDGSTEKITSEHVVFPSDIHVKPIIQENILDLNVVKITNPNETPTLKSMYISYPYRDKKKRCDIPCSIKKIHRYEPSHITVHVLDEFNRQTQQEFRWPTLTPIHPIPSVEQQHSKPNISTQITLQIPTVVHASDRFEGWVLIENSEKKSKKVDVIVLDKKRQHILLQGRYEINDLFQRIPLQNIPLNTTDLSLYYAIDDTNHTSIHYSIQLRQDFRTLQKNIPFQVYLAEERERRNIQFIFSDQEWGYIFFSRYEHVDVLFQTLKWTDLPATIDVQWQRVLLGSLIWEDLYYGNIPIFQYFRKQVAQDHQTLLEYVRSGVDDPYVFLSLLVAQERGFYIPFDVFQIIKMHTTKHQSSALHLYLQFIIASTSIEVGIPKEKAKKLYKEASPSEKIWLIPILYTTQNETLLEELNSKIIPYLSTTEKGILLMTLRKVKDMYNPSYRLHRDLKQNHFWELVGHAFFLQRKRKYKDSDIEIDIRENYKHILDGIVRLDNFHYVTYKKLQPQESDVRITLTGKGMIRGGALSFIEEPMEAMGLTVDIEISSNSSNINLQNGFLHVNRNDIISFTYTSTTPNIHIPPNALLYPIQTQTQRKDNSQRYHTTQIYKALFCGEAYIPSASVYANKNIGYSQSLQINIPCNE